MCDFNIFALVGCKRSVDCYVRLVSEVSGETMGPIFKDKKVKEKIYLGCLTLQNHSDMFSPETSVTYCRSVP
jgi:hypothetical protein